MKIPVENVKAYTTYSVAAFVVIIGMGAIYALRDNVTAGDTTTIFAGFIGSALTFLFTQEVQTRTARQSQSATAQGAATTNGHTE